MGKIFEALEKAGKDNRTQPAVKADVARRVDSRRSVPEPSEDRQKTKHDSQNEPAPTRDIVHSAPEKRKSQIDTGSTGEGDTVRNLERVTAVPETPRKQEPSGLRTQAEPPRENESTTVVLVKPEKPDIARPTIRADQPRESANRTGENKREATKRSTGRDINIRYSKTKVQAYDPEELKKNRIFSIFDEIETSNEIKILRTQVLRKLKEIGGNSILVTSANPYEGKTFTSINLGVSIAKEFDRTVLIIDADLRQPTKKHTAFATEFFSLKVDKGLTDYLMGEAEIPDILINPGISKLTLIPSGQPVYNSPELLNSSRMEEMMAEIKSRYASDRLVIVDGPAMLPFPDALILSRYVDGVLPVVEVERTSADDLKKMMESLKDTCILGTVLNKNKA
jgi:non-specific protein-tyrosine kinase